MRRFEMSTPLVLASIILIIVGRNELRRRPLDAEAYNNRGRRLHRTAQKGIILILRLWVCILVPLSVFLGCATKPSPKPDARGLAESSMSEVVIRPGEPIHIACWMVTAGPGGRLGSDTKRGVEIAIEDKGGKIHDHRIKLSIQDTGCNAEGGQAAAVKLAADSTIVAAIGPSCSSEAKSGVPILWKAGIATVSPIAAGEKIPGFSR
jgi:ABC-type branched-subunit amino acid transport system substrate-binding protein